MYEIVPGQSGKVFEVPCKVRELQVSKIPPGRKFQRVVKMNCIFQSGGRKITAQPSYSLSPETSRSG